MTRMTSILYTAAALAVLGASSAFAAKCPMGHNSACNSPNSCLGYGWGVTNSTVTPYLGEAYAERCDENCKIVTVTLATNITGAEYDSSYQNAANAACNNTQ